MGKEYTIFFEKWRQCSRFLRETAPIVTEAFTNTDLEDTIKNYYEAALPCRDELPINFMIRNNQKSFYTQSSRHGGKMDYYFFELCIGQYLSIIPFLRATISKKWSALFYLGQKTQGYISRQKKEQHDQSEIETIVLDDFNGKQAIDFISGFDTNKYFFKIIVSKPTLLPIAENIYNRMKNIPTQDIFYTKKKNSSDSYIEIVLEQRNNRIFKNKKD